LQKCCDTLFYNFWIPSGIDVGETPNDITLVLTMKLLSLRVIRSAIRKNTAEPN
jgi:hypothetical protein